MYYDDIDFYAINKDQFDTKIEIHRVINRRTNETNGQKNLCYAILSYPMGYAILRAQVSLR